MKKVLFLCALVQCLSLNAQPWPKVKYSYAVAYLYNLDGKLYGQHKPVKNDKLDTTMVLPGVKLNTAQTDELVKLLSQNTETINAGLASCYIPHHAVVFYDDQHKIVAWMSACFMCDGVRFFPEKKVNYEKTATKKQTQKAEQQIKKLQEMVSSWGLMASEKEIDYINLKKEQVNPNKKETEEIVNEKLLNSLIRAYGNINAFKKDFAKPEQLKIDSTTKLTAGMDKFEFYTVKYNNSEFWLSGHAGQIFVDKAVIKDQGVNIMEEIFITMPAEKINQKLLGKNSDAKTIKVYNEQNYRNAIFIYENGLLKEIQYNFQ